MNRPIILQGISCALAVTAALGLGQAFADHIHGVPDAAPDKAHGEKLYNTTCVACHGNSGKGAIPGVPDLRGQDGRLARKDLETLLHNVEAGYRSPGSTLAMPPKGGNTGLSERDLVDILDYMREEFVAEAD
jgi:cytochrome c5